MVKSYIHPKPEQAAGFVPQRHRDALRLVAFGDSITASTRMKPPGRWPHLLANAIEGSVVVNAGIGGTTSGYGLHRYDRDVRSIQPHVVIINFVLNDGHVCYYECPGSYTTKLSPTQSEANLEALVDRVRADGAEPVFWTPLPFGPWRDNYRETDHHMIQRDLYALYADIACRVAHRNNAPLADLWERLEGAPDFPDRYLERPDNLHPTADAQPVIAETVAAAVATLRLEGIRGHADDPGQ